MNNSLEKIIEKGKIIKIRVPNEIWEDFFGLIRNLNKGQIRQCKNN